MIWELKKRVIGGKKAVMETNAILNPATGSLAISKAEIKEVSVKYCKKTLANNEPEENFKEDMVLKERVVKDFLNSSSGTFTARKETFDKMINKFKKSQKRNYDFLTKAGLHFQNAVFLFCQRMYKEEAFPLESQNITLHMIFNPIKGGGGQICPPF